MSDILNIADNYYDLGGGKYISYHELANNNKYSNRREEVWYEVPASYVLRELNDYNWTHNGAKVDLSYFKNRFGKSKTLLVKNKPDIDHKSHTLNVWYTPDGKEFSKDISKRLEREYLLKRNGGNSEVPAFYEEPLEVLDEVVVLGKAPANLEQLKEQQLEAERQEEEERYQQWLHSPKGEFNINQPLLTSWGGKGIDYLQGSVDDRAFYKMLHSPEMRKYDYLGLGLIAAPWMILGGAAGLGGLAAGASALAGTTAGNIIGNVAGGLAIGNILEGAQRRIFGSSIGDNISGTLLNWGVSPFISDMARPEYFLNPTGRTARAVWNGGKGLVNNIYNRFTDLGFRVGNRYVSISVPKNLLNSGIPLLQIKTTPVHTTGMNLDDVLKIDDLAGYNAVVITPTEAFSKLTRDELIEAMLRQFMRFDPTVQVTFDDISDDIVELFAKKSNLYLPPKLEGIGNRIVVPFITPEGRLVLLAHEHEGVTNNLSNIADIIKGYTDRATLSGREDIWKLNNVQFTVDNPIPLEAIAVGLDVPHIALMRGGRDGVDNIVFGVEPIGYTNDVIAGINIDHNKNALIKTVFSKSDLPRWQRTGLIMNKNTDYFVPGDLSGNVPIYLDVRNRINALVDKMAKLGKVNIDEIPYIQKDDAERIARDLIRNATRNKSIQLPKAEYNAYKLLKNIMNRHLDTNGTPNLFRSWNQKMYYDAVNDLRNSGYKIYNNKKEPKLTIHDYKIGGRIKRRFK